MYRVIALTLLFIIPTISYGDCATDHASIKTALTGEALVARNELFLKLCQSTTADPVDMTDPGLGTRFESPLRKGNTAITFGDYPKDLKSPITVAYLVDLDGSVKYPTIIIGSGNALAEAQVLRSMTEMKFKGPGKVDGKPVRVLMYWRMLPMTFK